MSVEVQVPQLGESVTEAVITRWLKSDGDTVDVDEPLCELESDKATLDLPSPAAGTLAVTKQAGETVKVGETIARIEPGAAKAAAASKPAAPAKAQTKPAKVEAMPTARQPAAASATAPAKPAPEAPPAGGGAAPASPAAKRVAEESGIDTATIEGSGRGGRVTKPDVVAAAEQRPEPAAPRLAPVARPAPAAASAQPRAAASADEERVAMTPLRRTIARRLVEAQHTAAILTTFNEIDMSAVMTLRAKYKDKFAEKHGVSLGFMSFFSRACVLALQEIREVNARIEGDEIVYSQRVHLGIAASTERGLVVPVVRNADRLGMADLEREIGRLAELARTNKLSMDDLSGGTFTISNGGVFGSLMSTPILNPPQSGILGMHKIEKRPIVVGDDIVVRPMMYVALSYDHRIVDGRGAVTFLVRVKERLESPERVLLDL